MGVGKSIGWQDAATSENVSLDANAAEGELAGRCWSGEGARLRGCTGC
jgi:hypothetical protein